MSFITLAEYLVTAFSILLVFTLLGLPLRWLLELIADEPIPVPTPLLGIGIATILGWYWYGPFGAFSVGIRIACLVAAVLTVVLAVRAWRGVRIDVRARRARLGPPLAIGFFTLVLFSVTCAGVLSLDYMTVGSAGNNDVAAYAIVGQHVRDNAIDDSGPIVGAELGGDRTQGSFDFGAIATVAAASSLGPFSDVWRYLLALLGVTTGLIAIAMYHLLELVAPRRTGLIGMVSIACVCPFLVAVVWSQYLLNQLLAFAMVVTVAQLLTRAAASSRRRAMAALTLATVPLVCHLYASYPHMLVGAPMLLLPLQLAGGPGIVRRAGRLTVAGIGSLIGAGAVLPRVFFRLPDIVRYLGDVEAGFVVPGFLPTEILGFVSTLGPVHEPRNWIPSIALLVLFAGASVVVIRRRTTRSAGVFAVTAVAVVLVSYLAVYLNGDGPSYRQFKWITFYTPVVVACMLLAFALACERIVGRIFDRPGLIVGGGLIAFCMIAVSNSETTTFPRARPLPGSILLLDELTFATSPALAGIDDLNIDLPPYGKTMWAAYFLRDREVSLVQASYFAQAQPTSEWTLQLAIAPIAPDAREVRQVNNTYVLVRR